MINEGDIVKLDWDSGFKLLGVGIVLRKYKDADTPLLVWWTKAEASGWKDADMLIKLETGQ